MKLIIHDLDEEEFKNIFSEPDEDVVLIGNSGEILNCIGCFGCWIKTPGKCIIRDQYGVRRPGSSAGAVTEATVLL